MTLVSAIIQGERSVFSHLLTNAILSAREGEAARLKRTGARGAPGERRPGLPDSYREICHLSYDVGEVRGELRYPGIIGTLYVRTFYHTLLSIIRDSVDLIPCSLTALKFACLHVPFTLRVYSVCRLSSPQSLKQRFCPTLLMKKSMSSPTVPITL